ncbi:phage portal protein family protein [Nocardia tengchongensis]|uniref:phage portal protein family protein n=1 Tax=Nocardia tengchongensis TaxID=2055889 RepID=UPI00361CA11A
MADQQQQSPVRGRVATRELGYAVSYPGDIWLQNTETTPELRWPLSVSVYDRMSRQDAQVQSVLRAIMLPVRRTTWRIDPNGARDEVAQFVSDDLHLPIVGADDETERPKRRIRNAFSWPEHVRMALQHIPYGHSFFERTYQIDDAGWAHLAKLSPRLQRSIANIVVAPNGDLVSIAQYAMGTMTGAFEAIAVGGAEAGGARIPAKRLVAYVNEREGGDWLGKSVLRSAYKNWILKDRLLRVQAQTIERNGMGIPVYYAGPQDRQQDLDLGQQMANDYRAGDSSGAALPNGAKLRLQGVEGALPDAMPVIEYHDSQIARSVLAHFLNLGTQTGSWALGSTFADFFVMSLQTTAQLIADTANAEIIEPLVDLNFSPDEPAPRIVFDEIGSRHDATAEALSLLIQAGAVFPDRRLEQAVRDMYGLPQKDPDAPDPSPNQKSAPPPTPSGEPTGDDPNDPDPQEGQ